MARDRDLLRILTVREIHTRYRNSVLNIAWAILTPVAMAAVYGLVLTQSFSVDSACSPYLTSMWTGLVIWTFFASALGTSVGSLVASSELISKVYFPRESIPLSVVAATLIDLFVGLISVALLMVIQGVDFTVHAVLAVLPLALLLVWTATLSILTSVMAAFARDVIHGVYLALRVGFFATPIMYEDSFLPAALAWSSKYNPIAVVVNGLRDTLLCGTSPDWKLLGIHGVVGVALLLGSVMYTRAVESRVVDVL